MPQLRTLSILLSLQFFFCFFAMGQSSHDPKIAGTLKFEGSEVGSEVKGRIELTLVKDGKPFARTEVLNPRFPQAYLLGPKNTIVAGVPFEGEFHLTAGLYDSRGIKIAAAKFEGVLAGARDIMLELKKE